MAGVAMALMAVGTGIQVAGKLKEGKMAEKIGKQRAAVDRLRGKQAFENAATEAEIMGEKRTRLVQSNLNKAAAGNISLSSPTLDAMEQEVRRQIGMDITNILNKGRQAKQGYMQSAAYEETMGKFQKKQSIWDAVGTGVSGAGSLAWMGYDAGFWGGGGNTQTYNNFTKYSGF